MRIEEAEPRIKELIAKHLPDYRFEWDKAERRFGCCYVNLKKITISKSLTELNPWEEVKDTVLHEIAHGLAGNGHGHDELWKNICVRIGARPKRCYSRSVLTPPKKWKGVCPACGRTVYGRVRRDMSCGKCSRTYNPKYKFIWTSNNELERSE